MKLFSSLIDTLAGNEQALVIARVHKIVYFVAAFFILLGVAMLMTGILLTPKFVLFAVLDGAGAFVIFIGLVDMLRSRCREMICTPQRVIDKRGIFSMRTDELRNDKIEAISVTQTIMGRLLGYGNVRFSGTGTNQVIFRTIANPLETKLAFENVIGQSGHTPS